ncbi:MAG: radical SAM protein, partial [Bacteroidota bacterium]
MDILFTHSYFYKFDAKQWGFKQPYPPLGTILAASVMREEGFSVALTDTALADGPDIIHPVIKQETPKYLVVYDDGFNYLTKMCLTTMREAAFEMMKMGKDQGCTVMVCSSDSTDHYEKYLESGADFVLLGEGEVTLKNLINCLENDLPFDSI